MMDISVIYWHWTFGGDMDCVDAEILWLCLLTYYIWGDSENYKSTCPGTPASSSLMILLIDNDEQKAIVMGDVFMNKIN